MTEVEHPADNCPHCAECTDYITWLETALLGTVESYQGLVGVLRAQAHLSETSEQLGTLYEQSRQVVLRRRLDQIERHLDGGDDPQR